MVFQMGVIAVMAGLFWLQKGDKETVVGARDTLGAAPGGRAGRRCSSWPLCLPTLQLP